MRTITWLALVLLAVVPTALAAPCEGTKESGLPLPSSYEHNQDPSAYQKVLFNFLNGNEYAKLDWCVDKGLRDTGPFVNNTSFGIHPVVRIYYSPAVMNWLRSGRNKPIPDGAMIIKEQFSPTPASQWSQWNDQQLHDWFFNGHADWTVMIKDSKSAADGWYWTELWQGITWDSYAAPFNVFNSGFGLYCLRCHASAEKELTFAATSNIKGFPGSPITYRDDQSWRWGDPKNIIGPPPLTATAPPLQTSAVTDAVPVLVPGATAPAQHPVLRDLAAANHPHSSGIAMKSPDAHVLPIPGENYDHVVSPHEKPQHFITSDQCFGCHSGNLYGTVMLWEDSRFKNPKTGASPLANISPYGEWRWSPMGLAGRDPVFYAQVDSEIAFLEAAGKPRVKDDVVNLCFSCHGAMGQRQLELDHKERFKRDYVDIVDLKDPRYEYAALARDGVSCSICHHIKRDDSPVAEFLAKAVTGAFSYTPATEIGGPFTKPSTVPMKNGLGIDPVQDDYTKSSRLCGTCHAINLPNVDAKGPGKTSPYDQCTDGGGHCSFEQATYIEWLNSVYQNEIGKPGPEVKSCQDCHMKGTFVGDNVETQIAVVEDNKYPAADHRAPDADLQVEFRTTGYARHQLQGLNAFLLGFFKQYSSILGVRTCDYMASGCSGASDVNNFQASMQNFVDQARDETATLSTSLQLKGDSLVADVTVTNKTGHRFPSGVSFRRAFVEFVVSDKETGKVLFESGQTNANGQIIDMAGNPLPSEFVGSNGPNGQAYQPHYWTENPITRSDQVQIYEELIKDADGKFTTSFIRQDEHFKDNRLLPKGWKFDGPDKKLFFGKPLEATHSHGTGGDPHYKDPLGASGMSVVRYQVPLAGHLQLSSLNVTAKLYYQTIPPYYLNQRFEQIPNAPSAQRLRYMVEHFNTKETYDTNSAPLENWKLLVAQWSN